MNQTFITLHSTSQFSRSLYLKDSYIVTSEIDRVKVKHKIQVAQDVTKKTPKPELYAIKA